LTLLVQPCMTPTLTFTISSFIVCIALHFLVSKTIIVVVYTNATTTTTTTTTTKSSIPQPSSACVPKNGAVLNTILDGIWRQSELSDLQVVLFSLSALPEWSLSFSRSLCGHDACGAKGDVQDQIRDVNDWTDRGVQDFITFADHCRRFIASIGCILWRIFWERYDACGRIEPLIAQPAADHQQSQCMHPGAMAVTSKLADRSARWFRCDVCVMQSHHLQFRHVVVTVWYIAPKWITLDRNCSSVDEVTYLWRHIGGYLIRPLSCTHTFTASAAGTICLGLPQWRHKSSLLVPSSRVFAWIILYLR